MGKHIYRHLPCGYCGRVTHRNEGEHVIPKCLYPPLTDTTVQRLKISACPNCNDSWQADEAFFRNVLTLAGPVPNLGRAELWQKILKGFDNPRGKRNLLDLWDSLAPESGRQRVYPGNDQRVVRVVRKIVRGLCHSHNSQNIIPGDRVEAKIMLYRIPSGFETELITIYRVPDVFLGRATFFQDTEFAAEMHSAWLLKFFTDVEFIAVVAPSHEAQPLRTETAATADSTAGE